MSGVAVDRRGAAVRGAHGIDWNGARTLAARWQPLRPTDVPLRAAVGAVLADDAVARRPVPHYDSSAMDGWAVAGAPPWRLTAQHPLAPGQAAEIVTGGALPVGTEAIVPAERGVVLDGLLEAAPPGRGAHVRRAGEEAPAGSVLVPAGTRLSAAHIAMLAIAGTDALRVRARPHIGFVLTGDEVVTNGLPGAGQVRDAFDPLLPLAASRLGGDPLAAQRVGDDPASIRGALASMGDADVLVTVGGTGRSRADRLREALGPSAQVVFDGVAMRPGHPALLVRLPDGRPVLGLPGNPFAAVAVLLSVLPPLVDALAGAAPSPLMTAMAAVDLPGWVGGASLVPCRASAAGLEPAAATRPNMLRGLAASDVIAVVPPEGAPRGKPVRCLPLPW